jgi:hypothetical protein
LLGFSRFAAERLEDHGESGHRAVMVKLDPFVGCADGLVPARLSVVLVGHAGFDLIVMYAAAFGIQLRDQSLVTLDEGFVATNRRFVLLDRGDFGSQRGLKIREKLSLFLLPFIDVLPPHRDIRLPAQVIGMQEHAVLGTH